MSQSAFGARGIVPYSALVGRVIQQRRLHMGFHQDPVAASLGISQSAYSRLESGDTILSLSQLRIISTMLQTTGADILAEADQLTAYLQLQGIQVTEDRKDNSTAVLIGLGLLAAAAVAISSTK